MAALAGVETAVRLHIKRGDNLNARDAAGMTPLMRAATKNKASVCSLLLGAGADPRLTDTSGRDALAIAKASRAEGVIAVLEAVFAPPRSLSQNQDQSHQWNPGEGFRFDPIRKRLALKSCADASAPCRTPSRNSRSCPAARVIATW